MELPVQRLDPGLEAPGHAHRGDAGLDLRAAADAVLEPGERAVIPTGVAVAIPEGHAGLVVPRSGLAARHGIGVVNGPGLIDSGYRGEVRVVLVNHDPHDKFEVRRGDRIAQLVIVPVPAVTVREVRELPSSGRGDGGFGSTGR